MAVAISRGVYRRLIVAAATTPDVEVCGILFGAGDRIDDLMITCNVAALPENQFEIDPAALIAAHRRARDGGPSIAGYFHSHPNGLCEPSKTDSESMTGDGAIWAIVAGGQVTLWRATPGGFVMQDVELVD